MLDFAVLDKKTDSKKISPKMALSARPEGPFWAHFLTLKNAIFPKNKPSGLAEKAILDLILDLVFCRKRRYIP